MANSRSSPRASDPYDLSRFVQAQADVYERAFAELTSGQKARRPEGQKSSHWMWYLGQAINLCLLTFARQSGIGQVRPSDCSMKVSLERLLHSDTRHFSFSMGFHSILRVATRSCGFKLGIVSNCGQFSPCRHRTEADSTRKFN